MAFNRLMFYALFVFVGLQSFIAVNLGLSFVSFSDEIFVFLCILLLIFQTVNRLAFIPRFFWLIVVFIVLAILSAFGLTRTWTQVIVGYLDIYKNFFMIIGLPIFLRSTGIGSWVVEMTLIRFLYASIVFTVFFYIFPTSFLNANPDQIRIGVFRLSGFVSDINSYAFILLLLLFAVQTEFIKISNKRVISAFLLLFIFLTFSRSTMLVSIIGLILINAQSLKKLSVYMAVVIAMFVSMSIYDARTIAAADRPSQEFVWNPVSTTEVSENFGETQYRMVVYLKSLQMFLEAPLIGHGLGTFGTPISLMERSPLYEKYGFQQLEFVEGGFNVQDAYYPIIYVQSGLVGVILFGCISFTFLVRHRNGREKRFFLLSYFCIVVLSLNSMTFMVGSLMFFYALFIAIAELRYLEQLDQYDLNLQSTNLLRHK